jgi:putative SOS response-associated peptidase YedK
MRIMCGRFAQRSDPKKLAKEFKVAEVSDIEARYNIAPTQDILAVRESADGDRSCTNIHST